MRAGPDVPAGGVRWLLAAPAAQPSLPAEGDGRARPVHGAMAEKEVQIPRLAPLARDDIA